MTSIVLATCLDAAGHDASIFDDNDVFDKYGCEIREQLREADIALVSTTYLQNVKPIKAVLAEIRRTAPGIKIVVGGQGLMYWEHSSCLADVAQTLSDADALVFGDAEGVVERLVEELQQPSPKPLGGTVYLHPAGGGPLESDSSPNWAAIDDTPIPDWGLLRRLQINGALGSEFTEVSLEEGRVCAFKCSYCAFPLYNRFRRKSADRIVREIESVYEAGFRKAAFVGAEFFHPIPVVRETAQKLAARALPVDIWVFGRIDLMAKHPDLPRLLARAGIRHINFGLESGDHAIQQAMNKKIQLERIPEIMEWLHEAGISVAASLVLGFPGETHETVRRTAAVVSGCGFDSVMIHSLQVVPGTPLWKRREEFELSMPRPRVWMHKTMGLHELPEEIL